MPVQKESPAHGHLGADQLRASMREATELASQRKGLQDQANRILDEMSHPDFSSADIHAKAAALHQIFEKLEAIAVKLGTSDSPFHEMSMGLFKSRFARNVLSILEREDPRFRECQDILSRYVKREVSPTDAEAALDYIKERLKEYGVEYPYKINMRGTA